MRCPKCGYISFDHLENCLKCNKDIQEASEQLQGTVYNVTPPVFLKFESEQEPEEPDFADSAFDDDDVYADEEIRDPDLDILLTEDEEQDEVEIDLSVDSDDEDVAFDLDVEDEDDDGIDIALEEDDDGIDFSLDQFDDEESDFPTLGADEPDLEISDDIPAMELPDELDDISDLNPPAAESVSEPEPVAALDDSGPAFLADDAIDDSDFDLDLDLDLDDGSLGGEAPSDDLDLADLSLDDLEFDDEPKKVAPKKKVASLDLDEELNFDLDLGDLDLGED